MQIKIENFGPIKSFDFDLDKDFHVIYGKNNIGKSYAISVVYVVLKAILNSEKGLFHAGDFRNHWFELTHNNHIKKLNKILDEISNENVTEKTTIIKSILHDVVEDMLSHDLLPKLRESFKNSFSQVDNIQNRLSSEKFKISLIFKKLKFSFTLNEVNELIISDLHIDRAVRVILIKNNENAKYSGQEIRFYIRKNAIEKEKGIMPGTFYGHCFNQLRVSFLEIYWYVSNVLFLPASRSGLYEGMNVFSPVFAKLSQSRNTLNEKIEIPTLSEPTSDYFLNLSTIDSSVKKDIYSEFASEIEQDILGAEIIFNDHKKRLEYFNPKLKLHLDLSETSSMVSEIAPIVAHLKYIIKESKNTNGHPFPPSKVIFVEEPEAHLHPEIQIKLMDIFAQLTKYNLKIVLTTHSSYIFNKINNLILANDLPPKKVANYYMLNTEEGSIVADEKEVSEIGMTDENFVNVLEKLYNERLEILD